MKEENKITFTFSQVIATAQSVSHDSLTDMTGHCNRGYYKIDHRDTNTLLSITLSTNAAFYVQPAAMVAMSPQVTIKGKFKFSFKQMLTGDEMSTDSHSPPSITFGQIFSDDHH